MKTPESVEVEVLQVYETRKEAESEVFKYAKMAKDWGLVPVCRVKAAPMQKGRYTGTWGVWLVKHHKSS